VVPTPERQIAPIRRDTRSGASEKLGIVMESCYAIHCYFVPTVALRSEQRGPMLPVRIPLGYRTAEQLLANAAEMEGMAATATNWRVQQSLKKLADRYRALAALRLEEIAGGQA
jgi:hypothetical protein